MANRIYFKTTDGRYIDLNKKEDMKKAKVAIGTVATWADGKQYRKVSENQWEPDKSEKSHDAKLGGGAHGYGKHDVSTAPKLHKRFMDYLQNMSQEHRDIFRGGKFDFEKKTFTAIGGKVALLWKDDKVNIIKTGDLAKARVTKYIKRVPKPSGKGYYYFYTKQQFQTYKETGKVPEESKSSGSVWDRLKSFFTGNVQEKVERLHKEVSGQGISITKNSLAEHLAEYLQNKSKWDSKFSGQKKEKGESKPRSEAPKSEKKAGEKKENKWNTNVMKFFSNQYGAISALAKEKESNQQDKKLSDKAEGLSNKITEMIDKSDAYQQKFLDSKGISISEARSMSKEKQQKLQKEYSKWHEENKKKYGDDYKEKAGAEKFVEAAAESEYNLKNLKSQKIVNFKGDDTDYHVVDDWTQDGIRLYRVVIDEKISQFDNTKDTDKREVLSEVIPSSEFEDKKSKDNFDTMPEGDDPYVIKNSKGEEFKIEKQPDSNIVSQSGKSEVWQSFLKEAGKSKWIKGPSGAKKAMFNFIKEQAQSNNSKIVSAETVKPEEKSSTVDQSIDKFKIKRQLEDDLINSKPVKQSVLDMFPDVKKKWEGRAKIEPENNKPSATQALKEELGKKKSEGTKKEGEYKVDKIKDEKDNELWQLTDKENNRFTVNKTENGWRVKMGFSDKISIIGSKFANTPEEAIGIYLKGIGKEIKSEPKKEEIKSEEKKSTGQTQENQEKDVIKSLKESYKNKSERQLKELLKPLKENPEHNSLRIKAIEEILSPKSAQDKYDQAKQTISSFESEEVKSDYDKKEWEEYVKEMMDDLKSDLTYYDKGDKNYEKAKSGIEKIKEYQESIKNLSKYKEKAIDESGQGKMFKALSNLREELMQKAQPTKYIKRIPSPKGKGYIYFYTQDQVKAYQKDGTIPDQGKKPEIKPDQGGDKKQVLKDALKKVANIFAEALSGKDAVAPTGQAVENAGENINENAKNEQKKSEIEKIKKQNEENKPKKQDKPEEPKSEESKPETPEKKKPKYNPHTGKLIEKKEPKFDTETGKPLNKESEEKPEPEKKDPKQELKQELEKKKSNDFNNTPEQRKEAEKNTNKIKEEDKKEKDKKDKEKKSLDKQTSEARRYHNIK